MSVDNYWGEPTAGGNQGQAGSQQSGQAQPLQYQQAPQYQQYPQYQQVPTGQFNAPKEQPVSTGEWVLNLFLVGIPIVGLVLLFVWAFGSSASESKRNWARANLIWLLVGIVLTIVAGIVVTALGYSVYNLHPNTYSTRML